MQKFCSHFANEQNFANFDESEKNVALGAMLHCLKGTGLC
jgi:hypothetical protein